VLFELITYVEGQGSSLAIGVYLIKYKERKRQKELKEQQKRNKTRQPSRRTTHIACDSFPFYEPCRSYYK
jgi:hypothetical protein